MSPPIFTLKHTEVFHREQQRSYQVRRKKGPNGRSIQVRCPTMTYTTTLRLAWTWSSENWTKRTRNGSDGCSGGGGDSGDSGGGVSKAITPLGARSGRVMAIQVAPMTMIISAVMSNRWRNKTTVKRKDCGATTMMADGHLIVESLLQSLNWGKKAAMPTTMFRCPG